MWMELESNLKITKHNEGVTLFGLEPVCQ